MTTTTQTITEQPLPKYLTLSPEQLMSDSPSPYHCRCDCVLSRSHDSDNEIEFVTEEQQAPTPDHESSWAESETLAEDSTEESASDSDDEATWPIRALPLTMPSPHAARAERQILDQPATWTGAFLQRLEVERLLRAAARGDGAESSVYSDSSESMRAEPGSGERSLESSFFVDPAAGVWGLGGSDGLLEDMDGGFN